MNPNSDMNSPHDPYRDRQRQKENEWLRFFLSEPHLLDKVEPAPPRNGDGQHENRTPRIIYRWDEIPNVFTLAAPAIEWLVEGLVPRASVTLVAGEPGSYKTWLALALLRGVAAGGNFLGRTCTQTSVLYLDRENPLAVVRERLGILGIDSLAGSRIWGNWACDAPPAIGDARLEEIARERRPLIIFDSLIRFHAADENSATEMAAVMADLRALANAGATVVALHHKPKSEATLYRGSSDIAGGVDVAWAVSRDRGGGAPRSPVRGAWGTGLLRLECFKSRFAEEFSLTLRPELTGPPGRRLVEPGGSVRGGDFVVTNAPEADAERSDVERLADAIRLHPGQSRQGVIEASGVAQARARSLLDRFEGKLWRTQRGQRKTKLLFPIEDSETEALPAETDM